MKCLHLGILEIGIFNSTKFKLTMYIDGLEQNHPLQSPNQASHFPPRFRLIIRDLLVAYISIFSLVAGNIVLNGLEVDLLFRILIMIFSGILVAFLFHFLFLFLHEAGHFNLYLNHKINDLLGNFFVGYWFFQDTGLYRRMHWKHHVYHGETVDPENSYFLPLTIGNLLKVFSGYSTFLKVFAWKEAQTIEKGDPKDRKAKLQALLFFGVYNIAVIIPFILQDAWILYIVVWLIPLFCGFPVLAFIRQECEHRQLGSGATVFGKQAPGKFSAVFRPTLGAYLMGGAGFRLHWYHHFNPYISYTRLGDFAMKVKNTLPELNSSLNEIGYLNTFVKLLQDAYRPSQSF